MTTYCASPVPASALPPIVLDQETVAMTGIIDPTDLTQGQRDALRLADSARLFRRPHGWNAAGAGRRITLATGKALIRLGLAREDRTGAHPRLVVTGAGRNVLAVIEQRQTRRRPGVEVRP